VPDTELPLNEIDWPPLAGPPGKERFETLQPIPTFELPEPPQAAA
jgi:hypothetical protein